MVAVRALQESLDYWRVQSCAPGVSAAVRIDGHLYWNGNSSDEPFPSTPRFPIYSITKTLTSISALRLHEAGQLPVASKVARWLPDLSLPPSITVGHLLQHTSGIGDYGSLREYHEAVRTRPSQPWNDQQFIDAVLPRGLLFEPGGGWAYSNIGYMLLRLILEKATGESFQQCVYDLVISPLGLRDTFVAKDLEDWPTCVPGYGTEVNPSGKPVDIRPVYHPGWCATGVAVSTAEETTAIFDALFGGELLSDSALEMMITLVRVPGSHPPAVTPSCGMGILADPDSPFGASYGHGGGGPGYSLDVTVLPKSALGRLSIATFVDTRYGPTAEQAAAELKQQLFGDAA